MAGPRRDRGRWVAAAVLVLLVGSASAAGGRKARSEAAERALIERETAFATVAASGDFGAFLEFWAEDASYLGTSGRPVHGRQQIGDAWRPLLESPELRLSWTPERAEVARSGELGYTWGRWVLFRDGPEGEVETANGAYATVWRRGRDGTWRVVLDVGTTESP